MKQEVNKFVNLTLSVQVHITGSADGLVLFEIDNIKVLCKIRT